MQKDERKAEVLCDFFSSVFCTENDTVFPVLSHKECDAASTPPNFDLDDIINRLKKLNINKSPGPDSIHPRILYETADQIAYPLKLIFESCFYNKCLPSEWKYANITPIYKKGSRSDPGYYRPVSLTSIVCKLMESIIRDSIMAHFKTNKLFTNKQFGFIKGRSTTLQLLQILDKWTELLESGGQVDVVYTDLEKSI